MKKSEMYKAAQLAVVKEECMSAEMRLEIINQLQIDEKMAKTIEEIEETKKAEAKEVEGDENV